MLSLLIPATALKKVTRKLEKLAARCGVSVTAEPGTTYLIAQDTYIDRFSRGCKGQWPTVTEGAEGEDKDAVCELCHVAAEAHEGERSRVMIECSRVTVGEMPRADWEFVARLSHTEGGVIVACAPGETCPQWFRETPNACEHCGTSRRRTETFVIRHVTTGELRQIGRNCLADFIMASPDAIVARAELAALCSEPCEDSEWGYGGGGHWILSTSEFVAACVAAVRVHGFRKSGQENSTRGTANWICGLPPRKAREYAEWKKSQPNDADKALAATILAWTPAGTSDFAQNLGVALRCAGAESKRQGILAAAPTAYAREMGTLAERKARPEAGHFGVVKARLTFRATLLRIVYIDNQWGGKSLCIFRTAEGHSILWSASGAAPSSEDVGHEFEVKATIKKHGEYKGKPQTEVSRAKWTRVETTEASNAA